MGSFPKDEILKINIAEVYKNEKGGGIVPPRNVKVKIRCYSQQ